MRYSIMGATVQQVISVGGTDIKEAKSAKIIFATLSQGQADRLKLQGVSLTLVGEVKAVVMPITITPPTPIAAIPTYTPGELTWNLGLEQLRSVVSPPLYGVGMNLAIIGTGIRETHEGINGRVVYSKNYTKDVFRDGLDHDTGVCSIITTMAPLCNILNLKVLNEKGEGTEEDVALAIDDCISLWDAHSDMAPTVINMSLGGPDDGNINNPLRVVCRAAIAKGIWLFASAGNGGTAKYSVTCPSCEKYVVAIGSAKFEPFTISDFSSRGPTREGLIKPDAVMFGENLIISSSVNDTAVIAKSGTSFATPFASAIALLYHEGVKRKALTTYKLVELPPAEVYYISSQELVDTYLSLLCVKPEDVIPGKDYDYGYGAPYGPLVAQALKLVPAVDISTIMQPILGIAMLGLLMGMIITPITKVSK